MAEDPDFKRYLEVRMQELKAGVEELLDMHDRYGDTLQKSYLYKARHALKDGLEWFDWSRKRAAQASPSPTPCDAHDTRERCPHVLPREENICGPCSEGRATVPAEAKP